MLIKNVSRFFFFAMFLFAASLSTATQGKILSENPYKMVDGITQEIISIIAENQKIAEQDQSEQQFFNQLDELLSSHVDFRWISLNVMGQYRKKASDEQKGMFVETFRRSLVETYGRGLLSYSNEQIVLVSKESDFSKQRKVTIKQEIRGVDDVYPLEYTVAKNKAGEWWIINVVINGINLGKTFRNQFMQSAQKSAGNLDQVISNWSSEAS